MKSKDQKPPQEPPSNLQTLQSQQSTTVLTDVSQKLQVELDALYNRPKASLTIAEGLSATSLWAVQRDREGLKSLQMTFYSELTLALKFFGINFEPEMKNMLFDQIFDLFPDSTGVDFILFGQAMASGRVKSNAQNAILHDGKVFGALTPAQVLGWYSRYYECKVAEREFAAKQSQINDAHPIATEAKPFLEKFILGMKNAFATRFDDFDFSENWKMKLEAFFTQKPKPSDLTVQGLHASAIRQGKPEIADYLLKLHTGERINHFNVFKGK